LIVLDVVSLSEDVIIQIACESTDGNIPLRKEYSRARL